MDLKRVSCSSVPLNGKVRVAHIPAGRHLGRPDPMTVILALRPIHLSLY